MGKSLPYSFTFTPNICGPIEPQVPLRKTGRSHRQEVDMLRMLMMSVYKLCHLYSVKRSLRTTPRAKFVLLTILNIL